MNENYASSNHRILHARTDSLHNPLAFNAWAIATKLLPSIRSRKCWGCHEVETEDFLGRHHVPLSEITEAELDREAHYSKRRRAVRVSKFTA